jgi:hypothetical protein
MCMVPVYWLSHEEFLEWLSIQVSEPLPRHKQAFVLNILVILAVDVLSNNKKGIILEIAEAIIKDRLCCVSQHIVGVFSKKVSHFYMLALSILLTSYYCNPCLPCNIAMIGKKARSCNCWSVK